ncbi:hypothetical protein GCM10027615_72260 [Plantactinospora veratri]
MPGDRRHGQPGESHLVRQLGGGVRDPLTRQTLAWHTDLSASKQKLNDPKIVAGSSALPAGGGESGPGPPANRVPMGISGLPCRVWRAYC